MTDMGKLHHFLGVKSDFNAKCLFLSQTLYAQEILERVGMKYCKPCVTPIDLKSKPPADDGDPVPDLMWYWSLAGALQYLTFTRPDTLYVVHHICLYVHNPHIP